MSIAEDRRQAERDLALLSEAAELFQSNLGPRGGAADKAAEKVLAKYDRAELRSAARTLREEIEDRTMLEKLAVTTWALGDLRALQDRCRTMLRNI